MRTPCGHCRCRGCRTFHCRESQDQDLSLLRQSDRQIKGLICQMAAAAQAWCPHRGCRRENHPGIRGDVADQGRACYQCDSDQECRGCRHRRSGKRAPHGSQTRGSRRRLSRPRGPKRRGRCRAVGEGALLGSVQSRRVGVGPVAFPLFASAIDLERLMVCTTGSCYMIFVIMSSLSYNL